MKLVPLKVNFNKLTLEINLLWEIVIKVTIQLQMVPTIFGIILISSISLREAVVREYFL